jgi:hypothetical protein
MSLLIPRRASFPGAAGTEQCWQVKGKSSNAFSLYAGVLNWQDEFVFNVDENSPES